MNERVADSEINQELMKEADVDSDVDIDEVLLKADPALKKQFESLNDDLKEVVVLGESLNLDGEDHNDNHHLSLKTKLRLRFKKILIKSGNFLIDKILKLKSGLQWFINDGIKIVLHRLKSVVIYFKSILIGLQSKIKTWSLVKKISFVLVILVSLFLVYFYILILRSNFLNKNTYPYLGSLAEVATNEFVYDPVNEVEPLFGSGRVKVFAFQLKPFIVNLKRIDSGNPMAMVELVIEASSSDVLIEIKNRETEVRDLIARVIEKKTFTTLASADGKEHLREELRQEINYTLLNGDINRVQYINIIVKP